MLQHIRMGALCVLLAAGTAITAQQPPAQPNDQNTQSLGDAARHQRELKEQQARTAGNPINSSTPGSKSLGDVAREQQDKRFESVRTSLEDSRKLAASIDEILDFASHTSGYAKRAPVKHQLISEADVKRRFNENVDKAAAQRLVSSELVLKKFGYLPANFDLKAFLTGPRPKRVLAFYDPKTKMVNLLNFVEISEQMPILSHELTHALQDQNYDLLKFRKYNAQRQPPPPKMRVDTDDDEEGDARLAVVEGQAEVVHFDYMLKSYNRSLADTPQVMDFLQEAATRTYNDVFSINDAPLILKESSIFPYREGLNFELELFRTGGKEMAFAGAFSRPPRDTHDVLEPQAYIAGQKTPAVPMPDLAPILADAYEPYDSGVIGELDVRVMARQFGREEDALNLPHDWQGGAYVAVKRSTGTKNPANDKLAQTTVEKGAQTANDKPAQPAVEKPTTVSTGAPVQVPVNNLMQAAQKPAPASSDKSAPAGADNQVKVTTRDLALLYVSRWKTADAAQRFLEIYKNSLSRRVVVLETKNLEPANCPENSSTCGPLLATRVTTDEGPVFLEIWPNNVVFIAHSFDPERVNRLRRAVLIHPGSKASTSTASLKSSFTPGLGPDLSLRLFELPEFRAFEEGVGEEIWSSNYLTRGER